MDKLDIIRASKNNNSIFNFDNLISKYSKGTVEAIIEKEGYYDIENGGIYVKGETKTVTLFPAAIVPLSDSDVKFAEAGTYSEDNRKLYCYERLDKKTKITNIMNDGTKMNYIIMASKDYSDYDDNLHIYILKRGDRNDKDN